MKKPILIRDGSAIVKIFETVNNGYPAWLVVYWDSTGKRQRVKRSDLEDAKEFATQKAREISGRKGGRLTDSEAAEYLECAEMVKDTGKTVLEAVRAGIKASVKTDWKGDSKTVAEVYHELLAAKKADGVSRSYLQGISSRIGRFKDHFSGPVQYLRGEE
ncbi:MAG TPA: hypothetical protein VEC37_13715, partial [Bacillota bacterium]|nr:hypothetical protein [Bacillota bacterium]